MACTSSSRPAPARRPAVERTGTPEPDILYGSDHADKLAGGEGPDVLYGLGGDDSLDGGEIWTYYEDDRLDGGAGNDTLRGGPGRDRLEGGSGDDQLDGGAGDDYLTDYEGRNILVGGDGDDDLYTGSGATGILQGGEGNDSLVGTDGVDLEGGNGDDALSIVLEKTNLSSRVDGGSGNDTLRIAFRQGTQAQLELTGGAGVDSYSFTEYGAPAAGMRIRVTDFAAGTGGDRLDIQALLPSGYANNPFADGSLRLVEQGADTLLQRRLPGETANYQTILEFTGIQPAQLTSANFVGDLDPRGSTRGLTLVGTELADVLQGGLLDDTLQERGGDDRLTGNTGNDVLEGGAGNDDLRGDDGNDRLDGGSGDDDLLSEGGNNTLLGGEGNDTLRVYVAFNNQQLVLDGGAGADQLTILVRDASVTALARGGADADVFRLEDFGGKLEIADFTPGEGDQLDLRGLVPYEAEGNPFGKAGYLKLERVGADTLLYVDRDGAAGTRHAFALAATLTGLDPSLLTSAHFVGAYHPDGSNAGLSMTGTAGIDDLRGSALDDVIQGLGGTDTIYGNSGDDVIEGGDEEGREGDTLDGGAGKDTLRGGKGWDKLVGGIGDDLLDGGEGDDRLEGGDGDDVLAGGAGNDMLIDHKDGGSMDGGAGDDTIMAGLDRYFFDTAGTMSVSGGAGADQIRASIDVGAIDGGDGDDLIVLFGANAAGGDLLDVYSLVDVGADVNPFGAGKLRLVQRGDDAVLQRDRDGAAGPEAWADVVIFRKLSAGALTSENFTQGANPDGSPGGYVRTGSTQDDSMQGGTLADLLHGADGDDHLAGGKGNDTLHGDGGSDQLDGQAGDDTLRGGDGNDVLQDDEGVNLLDGGAGDDRLQSASDGSTLMGGDGDDWLGATGAGTLLDGGAGRDSITVDRLSRATDPGAITVHGGSGDDLITIYTGKGQADTVTIDGGAGSDRYLVPNLRSEASITILDFEAGEGGDVLDIFDFLPLDASPFASGQYVLEQRGADTVIRIDADGAAGPQEHIDLLTLKNLDKNTLTAANMAYGLPPDGSTAGVTWEGGGGGGDDRLDGERGNDVLDGGDGNDRLISSFGRDTLLGGNGDDLFQVGGHASAGRPAR